MQPYGFSLLKLYPGWWQLFLLIAFTSCIVTGVLFSVAKKRNLMPAIRDRDVHTARKPRVGGVAMWIVAAAALIGIAASPFMHDKLSFGSQQFLGVDRALWGILIGMALLLLFGLWDDIKSLSPWTQLLGQFLAATAIIWGGVQAEYIRLPFDGILYLNRTTFDLPTWLGGGTVWVFAALFSYLWVIAMINVMNFFDGLDGLAGSIATTGAAVLFFVCLRLGYVGPATLALVVAGVALGFLPWNWHPSKLFMGSVGSQTLGFLLAVTAIISGAKVATAILVLGMPLLDAIVVIVRRLMAKTSPFKADQRHLHHRLLKIGLPVPAVVLLINAVAVIFGLFALRTQNAQGKGRLTLILVACMVLFIAATYFLEQKAQKRVD
jgi:UDP-GlcNAc:undecaprenyl-phosphate GlcNAc-1-phosphate transferase